MSDILLIGLCLGHVTLIFLACSIATTLDEIRDLLDEIRDLLDCEDDDDGPDPIVGKFDPMLSPEFDDIA